MANPSQVENMISLVEAARSLPGRPHASSLYRWCRKGVRGVKLQTWLVGGRRYTTIAALEQFIAATTAAADGEPALPRTPRQRDRAIHAAEQELGIG